MVKSRRARACFSERCSTVGSAVGEASCRLRCRHHDRTPLWQPQHRHAEADMRGHAGAFPLGERLGKGHAIALNDDVHVSRPEAKQKIAHPAPTT